MKKLLTIILCVTLLVASAPSDGFCLRPAAYRCTIALEGQERQDRDISINIKYSTSNRESLFRRIVAAGLLICFVPAITVIIITGFLCGHWFKVKGILYHEKRVGFVKGEYREDITIWKFKTLKDTAGPSYYRPQDPRATIFGRILKASSLDEIPQLLQVALGDIALIGVRPRPQDVSKDKRFRQWKQTCQQHKISTGVFTICRFMPFQKILRNRIVTQEDVHEFSFDIAACQKNVYQNPWYVILSNFIYAPTIFLYKVKSRLFMQKRLYSSRADYILHDTLAATLSKKSVLDTSVERSGLAKMHQATALKFTFAEKTIASAA